MGRLCNDPDSSNDFGLSKLRGEVQYSYSVAFLKGCSDLVKGRSGALRDPIIRSFAVHHCDNQPGMPWRAFLWCGRCLQPAQAGPEVRHADSWQSLE